MPRKIITILRASVIAVILIIIAFLDFNNHLGLGPRDANGFTPFDHGIFGTTVKIVLAAAILYSLYYIFSQFIKYNWLRIVLTGIMAISLLIGGTLLSVNLYFTF